MQKIFLIGAGITILIIGGMGFLVKNQVKITETPTRQVSATGPGLTDIDAELQAMEEFLRQTSESDFDVSGLSATELGL